MIGSVPGNSERMARPSVKTRDSVSAGPGKWFFQARGPFLVLSVILVAIGGAAAFREGSRDWVSFFLVLVGVVSAHASVNLFNELHDWKSGIDQWTVRTPFSGGSGLLVSGKTSPSAVKAAAWGALALAAGIGFVFCATRTWTLLGLMVPSGLVIVFYTSHLTRRGWGEAASGLTLGSFVVMGVYRILAGHWTAAVAVLAVPPGILTTLLLLLNEFPDEEADRKGGRNHWVIRFGRKRCALLHAAGIAVVYIVIALAPLVTSLPWTICVGLGSLPLAARLVGQTIKISNQNVQWIPLLAQNTLLVLLTDLLLAVGLVLSVLV